MKKRTIQKLLRSLVCLLLIFQLADLAPVAEAATATANRNTIYSFLVKDLGMSKGGACGVLANIKAESSFNPNAVGDHGTSYGICQWHASRYTSLKNWCKKKGYSYTSLKGQLKYLQYELKNGYSGTYSYVKKCANTADGAYNAGYRWCKGFEKPADTEAASKARGNVARKVYWPMYKNGSGGGAALGESITKCTITLAKTSYTYDGKAKKPGVTVKLGSKKLLSGTDYLVLYNNNVEPGIATVKVIGIGDYEGDVSLKYNIYIDVPKLTKISNTEHGVTVKWEKVAKSERYRVYRKEKGGSWTCLGISKELIITDTTAVSGTAYQYTVSCAAANGDRISNYDPDGLKITYYKAPKISEVKSTKTGIKVTWGGVSGVPAYRILRKTGSGSYVTVGETTSKSWTDTKVKKGTAYTYSVRCISKDGKKNLSGYIAAGKKITASYTPS